MPAPGEFNESLALQVQENLETMFPNPTMVEAEFRHPVMTAKVYLENHGAVANEILEMGADSNGEDCEGVKLYFLRSENEGVDYSGTVADETLDCEVPVGQELYTDGKVYKNNMVIRKGFRVLDSECRDDMDYAMKVAKGQQKAMLEIRKEINNRLITFLSTSAQPNLDDDIPAEWDDTTAPPRIRIPKANFEWDLLGEIETNAMINDIENFHILNGRNFKQQVWQSDYSRLNVDTREAAAAFNDYNLHWDVKNIDRVLGRRATLLFDPNMFAFWVTNYGSTTPNMVKDNHWEYTVADPELRYMRNGQLVPVMYQVELSMKCIGRTKGQGRLRWAHDWMVRVIGGYDKAPTGLKGQTGVIEYEAV